MFKSCGAARFAYNWALSLMNKSYEETKKFLFIGDLRKQFTELRAGNEFKWLKEVSSEIPQQAIKDLGVALDKFSRIYLTILNSKRRVRANIHFFI